MTKERAIELLQKGRLGRDAFSEERKQSGPHEELLGLRLEDVDLSGFKLHGFKIEDAKFENVVFRSTAFERATLVDCTFIRCDFEKAVFHRTELERCVFGESCNLTQTNFNFARFRECVIKGVEATAAQFVSAEMDAIVERTNLHQSNFDKVIAAKIKFRNCTLSANFANATLRDASFEGSDLRACNLVDAELCNADLRDVQVNHQTRFNGANVEGMRVSRFVLECLDNFGGLTTGDRMRMRIEDDVAKLRNTYSGFLQWMHAAALVTFLAPYIFFVSVCVIRDRFGLAPDDASQLMLIEAIARFVWSGGTAIESWRFAFWPFTFFVFSLMYNFARFRLLWKTKRLELEQTSSGLPAQFVLQGGWRMLYEIGRWGLWVNLAVVVLHTIHFMTTLVPVPDR